MDLRRLMAVLRVWFPALVAATLLAACAAFVVSSVLPKSYEARATLFVGQSLSSANPDYNALLVSQRLSATYAAVATKRPILDAVIDQLGLDMTSDELARRVRASAPLDSTLLTVSAQDGDPARAAAIANELAAQLIAVSPTIQGREADFQASIDADLKATREQIQGIQAEIDALSASAEPPPEQDAALQTLEGRLVSLRSTYCHTPLSFSSGSSANLLKIIEPAAAPVEPEAPRVLLNTLLAAVLGFLAAAGIAFVADHVDDSIRGPEAVEEVAGMSTLGTVSRMNGTRRRSEIYRLAAILFPHSGVAEAYRTLRTNIEFASVDAPMRTLLVTSAIPGEGKTVTAANLGVVFAQAELRVLLVDADLRKPGLHALFDLPNSRGLTTLLRTDGASLETVAATTEVPGLRVLTTGPLPPNPAELLGSQRMRTVLAQLQASADLVLFDSPPLQAVTDSAILSSYMDATLLVIDAGRSRRRSVRMARETLSRAGAKVLGAVLNRYPPRARSDLAPYYGGYYTDVAAHDEPPPAPDVSKEATEPSLDAHGSA